jgi:hypothetical protein
LAEVMHEKEQNHFQVCDWLFRWHAVDFSKE